MSCEEAVPRMKLWEPGECQAAVDPAGRMLPGTAQKGGIGSSCPTEVRASTGMISGGRLLGFPQPPHLPPALEASSVFSPLCWLGFCMDLREMRSRIQVVNGSLPLCLLHLAGLQ